MKPSPEVIIRCNAGRIPGVSFGHAFRCMALGRELLRQGASVLFVMKDHPEGIAVVRQQGFRVLAIPLETSVEDDAATVAGLPADILVLDLIDSSAITKAIQATDKRVVVIDDTGCKPLKADLIINGSIGAERFAYPDTPRDSIRLLGIRYCILNEEFDHLPVGTAYRKNDLVIFMGGSDPAGLTLRVVRHLTTIEHPPSAEVILGASYPTAAAIKEMLGKAPTTVTVTQSPSSIIPSFHAARLAIIAGGRTAYETAALGVPSIILPSIAHEELPAQMFSQSKAAVRIRHAWKLGQEEFGQQLDANMRPLLESPGHLASMSEHASRLIDRAGRKRVATAVLQGKWHEC